jgi:hypothetical protein
MKEHAMPSLPADTAARRRFLQFLAASPLAASPGFLHAAERDAIEKLGKDGGLPAAAGSATGRSGLISRPSEAINVFDFEPVARRNVAPAHFGYLASGIDGELTLRANREALNRIQMRPRRMVDVSHADIRTELFGQTLASPIILAPVGGQKAYDPGGEVTVARGARAGGHLQILSTQTATSIEEVIAARGEPVWFQLYATQSWPIARALVTRAERAGAPVVAVTVDRVAGRNQETFSRMRREDPRPASRAMRRPRISRVRCVQSRCSTAWMSPACPISSRRT